MLVSDIKSRPLYGRLAPAPRARRHIVAAEREGLAAIEAVLCGDAELLARMTVVYTGPEAAERLAAIGADVVHVLPSVETALTRLGALLSNATMGTHLSVTGTENFIAQVVASAVSHGIVHTGITTEHRGSLARRVQCVHCKGYTSNVIESPVECSHCGLHLLVRDHYSRRLGAFMGVCIDAEAPGDVPAPQGFAA